MDEKDSVEHELDILAQQRRKAKWLVNKRTASKLLKAFTIGEEKLDQLLSEIADIYRLSDADRERLDKSNVADVLASTDQMVEAAASKAAAVSKAAETIKLVKQGADRGSRYSIIKDIIANGSEVAAKNVDSAKKVGEAIKTGGKAVGKAAEQAVSGSSKISLGKAVTKRFGVVTILTTAYGVVTTGVYTFRARQYERLCYELEKERIETKWAVIKSFKG